MHPCNFRGTREMSSIFFPLLLFQAADVERRRNRSIGRINTSLDISIKSKIRTPVNRTLFYWLHRRSNVKWYQLATWSAPMIWLMWPPNLCTLFRTSITLATNRCQRFFGRYLDDSRVFSLLFCNCFWIFSLFLLVFSTFSPFCLLFLHFLRFFSLWNIVFYLFLTFFSFLVVIDARKYDME